MPVPKLQRIIVMYPLQHYHQALKTNVKLDAFLFSITSYLCYRKCCHRTGLPNSFSSVVHHAYSDNSVDHSRYQKIIKTQKSIYTLHLIHNFTSILVYATVDVLPDFWMRLLLTSFSVLAVVLDKAQRRSLSTASRQILCLDFMFNRDEEPYSHE